jgi:hypothetical protein
MQDCLDCLTCEACGVATDASPRVDVLADAGQSASSSGGCNCAFHREPRGTCAVPWALLIAAAAIGARRGAKT